MTESIGTIKNPLTIIAIFAGIAEVSGTVVLPFIESENQLTFIYFLIIFPLLLVIAFFSTLNFNNKALYAPSDFTNEENYIKIFKYDISTQERVEVKVPQDELIQSINTDLIAYKDYSEERIKRLENEIKILRTEYKKDVQHEIDTENFDSDAEDFGTEGLYSEPMISISNMRDALKLVKKLREKGYSTEIYEPEKGVSNFRDHKAIWLGYKVPISDALEIISLAKSIYPHLEYIELSNVGGNMPPEYVHSQVYIGGSTATSMERNLKPLTPQDWRAIKSSTSIEELHSIIRSLQ